MVSESVKHTELLNCVRASVRASVRACVRACCGSKFYLPRHFNMQVCAVYFGHGASGRGWRVASCCQSAATTRARARARTRISRAETRAREATFRTATGCHGRT